MKKKLFIGVALMGVAFSGAAFTANRTLQMNHYIQLDEACEPIPLTKCTTDPNPVCKEWDGSQFRDVYESQGDGVTCQNQLYDRNF